MGRVLIDGSNVMKFTPENAPKLAQMRSNCAELENENCCFDCKSHNNSKLKHPKLLIHKDCRESESELSINICAGGVSDKVFTTKWMLHMRSCKNTKKNISDSLVKRCNVRVP